MNVIAHSITAVPFIALGMPYAALGCVIADATWVWNEWRFRKSGIKNWNEWANQSLNANNTMAYRLAHSALIVAPLCVAFGYWQFLLGWTIHLLLDLPTHGGYMTQRPLYPFKWKWKWILKKYQ